MIPGKVYGLVYTSQLLCSILIKLCKFKTWGLNVVFLSHSFVGLNVIKSRIDHEHYIHIQGYPQSIRLQRRLYGIFLWVFLHLGFVVDHLVNHQNTWLDVETKNKVSRFSSQFHPLWVTFSFHIFIFLVYLLMIICWWNSRINKHQENK